MALVPLASPLVLTTRAEAPPAGGTAASAALSTTAASAALLGRARAGDPAALRSVYDGFAPRVRRFLYGLLGCPASADDATQETFLRAFQRLDLVREGEPLAPWLFGIARLVSLEHRRARRRAGDPMAPDAIRSASFVDAGTPESALLGHEVAGVVRRALLAMPEERRAALLLRVDHDVPYEAIARLLGWSLAKAKVEVHRARATLHATLAAHAGETP